MLERVISGGQTGADRAGWEAAKAAGIPTGGWMPRMFIAEDGNWPEFAAMYGAKEHWSPNYPPRTVQNVKDADQTLWFGSIESRGARVTWRAFADKKNDEFHDRDSSPALYAKGWLAIVPEDSPHHLPPENCAHVLRSQQVRVVNVAGNRESSAPGINAWVRAYLAEVFRILVETGR